MSQYHNNNLLHNLRAGARMVQEGVDPDVASLALAKEGIIAPPSLLSALKQPEVLESMSTKPYTHARTDLLIAANRNFKEYMATLREQSDQEDTVSVHPLSSQTFSIPD